MTTLIRIAAGVLVAGLAVALLAVSLFAFTPGIAVGVGIAGAGALIAGANLHSRWLAVVGGLLAFGGVLAYALRAPLH